MKWSSHVFLLQLLQFAAPHLHALRTHSRQRHASPLLVYNLNLRGLRSLENLRGSLRGSHEARRLIDLPVLEDVFLRPLFDLDVEQTERVESYFQVALNFIQEGVGSPLLGEEGNGDHFSKAVGLQASEAHHAYDSGVENDIHFDSQACRSEEEVAVSCGSERISDYQEGEVLLGLVLDLQKHFVDLQLAEVSVCEEERPLVESLELLLVRHEDGGVVLEEDELGAPDDLEPLDGDIGGVAEAEPNEMQDHQQLPTASED